MVHKFSMNGYNIVIDVHTSSIHVLDDTAYAIVNYVKDNTIEEVISKFEEEYPRIDIVESYAEVKQLIDSKVLFTDDNYEEVLEETALNTSTVVKALCLHIAHDCNLKCEYCFADEGEYHGKRELMSLEVGKKSLDFLIENSGNRVNLEVDFFGGEPLMNFEVIKGIVAYGRELEKKHNKKFRFTLTTNGILLNEEIMEFADKEIHNCVLSIDGRKEVNDRVRPDFGKKGSYDKIVPKFQEMAKRRNQQGYYVRGTFTRYNLDFFNDVLHLADLGFKQISVEPVVASKDTKYYLRKEDLSFIFSEYEKLAKEMIKRKKRGEDFNFFHFMIDLDGGPCVKKRLVGCGAGTEYLAVTPTGDLYPCHQFVGEGDEFKVGTVFDGVSAKELVCEFGKCNVYAKPECKECWNKFYCSGGCAANAYQQNGSILSPYEVGCELQKKRTECAIMLKVNDAFGK